MTKGPALLRRLLRAKDCMDRASHEDGWSLAWPESARYRRRNALCWGSDWAAALWGDQTFQRDAQECLSLAAGLRYDENSMRQG